MTERQHVLSWWGDTTGSPGAQITVDQAGGLTGVLVGDAEQVVGALGVRGIGAERYRPDQVRIEADEIETSGTCAGVSVRVRHSFDRTWQLRIGLTNTGPQPVRIDRLLLDVGAGPDGWLEVFAAGAVAYLAFHRLTASPCLALRLSRGDLIAGPDGLGTPELELAPGGRYQLVLSGEWYARSVRHRLPAWFPESLDHPAADRVDPLIEDADLAVTVRTPEETPDLDLVNVAEPRGVTRLEVSYVEEDQVYDRVARELAARGTLRTAAEAHIVLRGLAAHHLAHDEAAGLVEAYLDRPGDEPGPLRVLLLLRARELLARDDLTARAVEVFRALPPGPGLALAAVHLLAATRDDPDGTVDLLDGVAGLLGDPGTDAVTCAELQLLLADPSVEGRRRGVRALREVELLCTTEPGELWPPRADAAIARALVLRSLLPEREAGGADHRLRRLMARAATAPDGAESLAWLLAGAAAI